MTDGIAKGVGEQLGQLGKQIATDVVTLPGQLTGLSNDRGPNETTGQGTGSSTKQQGQTQKSNQDITVKIESIKRRDEIEKQKQLAYARRLLDQFRKISEEEEMPIQKKLELEEMEKKKKEIEEERKKAEKVLQPMSAKPKKGNLYGIKSKQFGAEVGKNVKSQ